MRPSPLRRSARNFARAVSWHRRKLAVVAAVAAVLTAISAAAPADPPTSAVVRMVTSVEGGQTLTADDVRLEALPRSALPKLALTDVSEAVGRVVAAPRAEGAVLTTLDFVGPGLVAPGRVVAPLILADADAVHVVRSGDRIDVLAADPEAGVARVVASRVRVVTVPHPPGNDGRPSAPEGSRALVLVEVSPATATTLAQAAATAQLSIVLR